LLNLSPRVSRRIEELKRKISDGVVQLEVRQRSARVQILQNSVDGMLQVKAAHALEYADHPGGSSGLLVKDYRGEKVILKFDVALVSQLHATLKQVAIEEGQWTEKRDLKLVDVAGSKARINRGRQRVVDDKAAALARGETWR
jgi:hypothetical protein